jgi:transcriptional regulator with XRE-family HTH domain
MSGRSATCYQAINAAVSEALVFEVPGERPTRQTIKRASYSRSVVELSLSRPPAGQTAEGPDREAFKRKREELGYSQAEIANELGVSRGLVWLVERGERKLTHRLALKLADLPPSSDMRARRRAASIDQARERVVKWLENHGPTTKAQLRAKLGYGANLLEAIRRLAEDEHKIHYERTLVTQRGRQRQRDVLALGRGAKPRMPLGAPRVNELLKAAGVSRSELATELGVSRPTLANHLSGRRLLLAETTDRIPAAIESIARRRREDQRNLRRQLAKRLADHPNGISESALVDGLHYLAGPPAREVASMVKDDEAYRLETPGGTYYALRPWPDIDPDELVAARRAAGVSQRQAAELVPCTQSELCAIEQGRLEPPVALLRRLRYLVDEGYPWAREKRLAAIEHCVADNPLIALDRLLREHIGRGAQALNDVRDLLAAGRLHYGPVFAPTRGGQREISGLCVGPDAKPTCEPVGDLAAELRRRGLSHGKVAAMLGERGYRVSRPTVDGWCRGALSPGIAATRAIRRLLDEVPVLDVPAPTRPAPISDAELDEAVIAEVYRLPGRSQSQVAGSLPQGETRRRLRAVKRVAAAGRIVGRLGPTLPDALGRVFERICYWPPDLPV